MYELIFVLLSTRMILKILPYKTKLMDDDCLLFTVYYLFGFFFAQKSLSATGPELLTTMLEFIRNNDIAIGEECDKVYC